MSVRLGTGQNSERGERRSETYIAIHNSEFSVPRAESCTRGVAEIVVDIARDDWGTRQAIKIVRVHRRKEIVPPDESDKADG